MSLAEEVGAALGRPVRLRPVAGGDINDAYAADLDGGGRAFVKAHADPLPGTFAAEAAGLAWLAEPGELPVPAVLASGERWLALDWIEAGRLDAAGEEALGRGLAALHGAGTPAFGATAPGTPAADGHTVVPIRIGPILLSNDPLPAAPAAARGDAPGAAAGMDVPGAGPSPPPGWGAFYAERRLAPLAAMARDRGALPAQASRALDAVCERIDELAGPPEPPARLHGDLWAGNVLADAAGRPHLIDPAAHGGHRETDLAMLRLFGGPSERCFAAYAEVAPLTAGHAERVGLWQLMPLLAHAVLFGGSYGAAVGRTAARYL